MPEVETITNTVSIPVPSLDSLSRISSEEGFQWYALTVKPRFEKASAAALQMKGYDTFLPLYKKRHSYGGRSREFDLPLFPGYLFCRFNPWARLPILTTPGINQILGNGSGPKPVPDVEVASLKTALQANVNVQPFPYPPEGHKVRITKGALAGIEGTIVMVKDGMRLVLSINLLQRSVLL